jgi:DNA-binding MarR family transcriptional regulator
MSQTQVSELISLDKVSVSRSTAGLVHRGLLRQKDNPRDGRSHLLALTRKGATRYEQTLPLVSELETMLATPLSQREWRALRRTLGRLNTYLEAMEERDAGEASK